jgi:hypothetical protein
MVQIRRLRQLNTQFVIQMPKKADLPPPHRSSTIKIVTRRLIDFPPPTPQPTQCRLWQGAATKDGYGQRKVWDAKSQEWKTVSMHRWSMTQAMGRPLKPHEVVMHRCDNRFCYRIDHLQIGSLLDNNADMFAKKRNVLPPLTSMPGASHPMSKLTELAVQAIRWRVAAGETPAEVAPDFGVSVVTVRAIIAGRRWAHLAPPTEQPFE